MARSRKDAELELDRLQSMYRSMPNHKDDAAQQLAAKIKKVEGEIAAIASGQVKPAKKSGGAVPIFVWVLIALALGALAFAGAYFGGNMVQT
jgi:hypothetical protein